MRVREAAARLDVSPGMIYSLIASGKLRCYRVGNGRGVLRIGEEHLAEYLKGSEPASRPAAVEAPVRRLKLRHLDLD